MAIDAERLARELYEAQRMAQPVELLTVRVPDLSWDDARRIATASDDRRPSPKTLNQ